MTPEEIIEKEVRNKWDVSARGCLGGNIYPIVLKAMTEYASLITAEKDSEISLLKNQIANLELRLGERGETK